MFIERKINPLDNTVELWKCEWENHGDAPAKKKFIEKVGEERPLVPEDKSVLNKAPICWSYGQTLGNTAVFSPSILESFPATSGSDAVLPCEFVYAGKFRHGVDRWWCRTHQIHWGTKADHEAYDRAGVMICANHTQPMNYVVDPFKINVDDYAEVGIWCSLPAALSTQPVKPRPPKIHVHLRLEPGGVKKVDRDFAATSLVYKENLGLFGNSELTRVNVTPPAAFEFLCALEFGRETSCINCPACGCPHLDLGDFGRKAHRKHFCGNCGRDSNWSKDPIVSTPLKPLHDQLNRSGLPQKPATVLNLDEYAGCEYSIWASTPAVLWTAERVQQEGIHVHVHDGHQRIIDETFGDVVLNGNQLKRDELLQTMIARTTV